MPRIAAHVILLAFTAAMLLDFGCTGVQASPDPETVPVIAVSSAADAASPALPACIPGRDKVRLECHAMAPTPAQLQHSPASTGMELFSQIRTVKSTGQLAGRIPAALTHLDLGIVRT